MKNSKFELDRLVFFNDAIVAIAITFLALDLKVEIIPNGHLTMDSLFEVWPKLRGFLLSFYIISLFWRNHHKFFSHIVGLDNTLLRLTILWLLFIVILPFTTDLISSYFYDRPAILIYCINILLITWVQNKIWNHVISKPELIFEGTDQEELAEITFNCKVSISNALIASVISLLNPWYAVVILMMRLPMIKLVRRFN